MCCLPFVTHFALKKKGVNVAVSVMASVGLFLILSCESIVKYVNAVVSVIEMVWTGQAGGRPFGKRSGSLTQRCVCVAVATVCCMMLQVFGKHRIGRRSTGGVGTICVGRGGASCDVFCLEAEGRVKCLDRVREKERERESRPTGRPENWAPKM